MKITLIGAAGDEVLLAGQGDQTLPRASRPPAPPSVTSTPFVVEATSTRTPPMFCCRLWSVGLKSNNRIAQKAVNLLAAINMTTITDMVAPRAGDEVLPSARNHVGYRRHVYSR